MQFNCNSRAMSSTWPQPYLSGQHEKDGIVVDVLATLARFQLTDSENVAELQAAFHAGW